MVRFGLLKFATENRTELFSFLFNKTETKPNRKFLHRFDQFESVFSVLRFFAHPYSSVRVMLCNRSMKLVSIKSPKAETQWLGHHEYLTPDKRKKRDRGERNTEKARWLTKTWEGGCSPYVRRKRSKWKELNVQYKWSRKCSWFQQQRKKPNYNYRSRNSTHTNLLMDTLAEASTACILRTKRSIITDLKILFSFIEKAWKRTYYYLQLSWVIKL